VERLSEGKYTTGTEGGKDTTSMKRGKDTTGTEGGKDTTGTETLMIPVLNLQRKERPWTAKRLREREHTNGLMAEFEGGWQKMKESLRRTVSVP
jgi:hypothetical protein